jgi:hypothetical protein
MFKKMLIIILKILICSIWRKNDEILQQLYHEANMIMLLEGEVGLGDCGLEGGILGIYWHTEYELDRWWGFWVDLTDSFPHIWEAGDKTGGSIRRKAAWGVLGPQFLPLPHTHTPLQHLG